MTDQQLQLYYQNLLKRHFCHLPYNVKAVFYATKSIRHEIRLKGHLVIFKIAEPFRNEPLRVHSMLALILLDKLFRLRLPKEVKNEYYNYVRRNLSVQRTVRRRDPARSYSPVGKVFNLQEIFDGVNQRFFENRLDRPVLGWSKNKAYARLGFYDAGRNLLVISKIFDSKKAPREVLEFLMYHEMLHIYLPAQRGAGSKRRIHTAEFRQFEQAFPGYEKIKRWIERKRKRL
jgi:hypothetical protein